MSLCRKPSDIQSLKPRLIRQQWPGLHMDVAAVDCLHVTLTPHLNQRHRQYIEKLKDIVNVEWHRL